MARMLVRAVHWHVAGNKAQLMGKMVGARRLRLSLCTMGVTKVQWHCNAMDIWSRAEGFWCRGEGGVVQERLWSKERGPKRSESISTDGEIFTQ